MPDDGNKGPLGASLLASGTIAVVLSPLIFIAAGFHELARAVESDADLALTVVLYALPVVGVVICGIACMGSSTANVAMRRGTYLNASAVIVLLLGTLSAMNRSKTLMMEGVGRAGVDESMFQAVLATSRSLDSLVPAAFGICGVGIVLLIAMGRRYSRD